MDKRRNLYIGLLAAILGLFLSAEFLLPDKTDWSESFASKDKIPYGCYAINKMLPSIFPGIEIKQNNLSLFEYLHNSKSKTHRTLIIICDYFNPDQIDLDALVGFVYQGNTAFISALNFGHIISDSLKFQSFMYYNFNDILNAGPLQLFPRPLWKKEGYKFMKHFAAGWFTKVDSSNCRILGTDSKNEINLFSMKLGKGLLYLHSEPHVFTNDNILYDNKEYPSSVLSILPIQTVIWDNYYKPGRLISGSPIRFILSSASLKKAYYLLLFTILLYIFTEGRRRQRIIPLRPPLANSSLAFTRTIARLYYYRENHADLVQKKFMHFKEFLLEKYYLRTDILNEEWVVKAAEKCAISEKVFREIANIYNETKENKMVSKKDLMRFSIAVEEFYKNARNN